MNCSHHSGFPDGGQFLWSYISFLILAYNVGLVLYILTQLICPLMRIRITYSAQNKTFMFYSNAKNLLSTELQYLTGEKKKIDSFFYQSCLPSVLLQDCILLFTACFFLNYVLPPTVRLSALSRSIIKPGTRISAPKIERLTELKLSLFSYLRLYFLHDL